MMFQRQRNSSGMLTRAVVLVFWVTSSLWLEVGSAFTTYESNAGLPSMPPPGFGTTFSLQSQTSLYMATEAGEEEVSFVPHPPDSPPDLVPQLEQELEETQRRMMLYEAEIDHISELLTIRQEELDEERMNFRAERTSLKDKISELMGLMEKKNEAEVAAEAQRQVDFQKKEKQLRQEVASLTNQLAEKSKQYEAQGKIVDELKKKFGETQDALEYEQMNFQKERNRLEAVIAQEKLTIKSMEDKAKKQQESFELTQKELVQRVKKEEGKIVDAKTAWEDTRQTLQQREDELRKELKAKEEQLQESKKKLQAERGLYETERKELLGKIEDETKKVTGAQQRLRAEQDFFTKKQNDLELKIKQEQEIASQLQTEFDQGTKEFQSEKHDLEERIKVERVRLGELEGQLRKERDTLAKEKEVLLNDLANVQRVQALKRKQMNDRFVQIRKELTGLWESTKRENRKQYNRLTKKYDRQLNNVKAKVALLESDLETSKKYGLQLEGELEDVRAQKEAVIKQVQTLQDVVAKRDASVSELELRVDGLRKVVSEKDVVIQRHQTSLRSLLRLTLTVSGNKLKSSGRVLRRLRRLVQNSPPKELDE